MFVYLMSVFTYSMLFTPKMGKRLDKRVCPERILKSCFFGLGAVRARPARRVAKMVECVWACPLPAGQTVKGGVRIEVLLPYSKTAFLIGLSGLQEKTARFFPGGRRRAVAFDYSK